jgi:predicted kinase
MANLFIPIGIPGCGKSTWIEVFLGGRAKVVSTDDIRERRFGDVNDMSNNKLVFEIFHDHIEIALERGIDVVADATNLHRSSRERVKECAREQDKIHYILFRNSLQAIRQNKARSDRQVPDDVMMYRMLPAYERTLMDIRDEAYDTLTEIKRFE